MNEWRKLRQMAREASTDFQSFLKCENPLVREGLLDNPDLPKHIEEQMLSDRSPRIKMNLLKRPEYIDKIVSEESWRVKYQVINNNPEVPLKVLQELVNDKDIRVSQKASELLDIAAEYDFVDWYKDGISIKLAIPGECNARCGFCFNNLNDMRKIASEEDKQNFLEKFLLSLEDIITRIDGRQAISLDITGEEPTFDPEFLKRVLTALRGFSRRDQINRTTLTTNGYNLDKVISNLRGIVDYVNISVHHYDQEQREDVFNVPSPSDEEYKQLVLALMDIGIDSTVTAVLDKNIQPDFLDTFISWAKDIGFTSLRVRRDVYTNNTNFLDVLDQTRNDNNFTTIQEAKYPEAQWCQLATEDGFMVYFFEGREDGSTRDPGIEFIVHPDGQAYQDWNKQVPLDEYKLPIGYYFHKPGTEKSI
ncbi:MAG: radical SAM protein [Firmicutes bacterium]|nr:radical SAM protein [Bacillota bacterium]